jgi:MFS family permease
MKAVVAFLSGLIFVSLIFLAVTTLGGTPRESISDGGRIAGVPTLSTPALIVLSSVIGLAILGLLAASVSYLAAHRGMLKGMLSRSKDQLKAIQIIGYIILMTALTIAIAAFILSVVYHPDEEDLDSQNLLTAEAEPTEEEELYESEAPSVERLSPEDIERRNRIYKILLVPLGIALFAVILLFTLRLYRSRLPAKSEERDLEKLKKELAKAVQLSLRDILRNRDYRAAVIACYARMELVLSGNGFPRYIHQTPLEYMESTLKAAQTVASKRSGSQERSPSDRPEPSAQALPGEALLKLTQLYEIAKFSTHPIGSGDRDEAIRCLTELGEKLSTQIFRDDEAVV